MTLSAGRRTRWRLWQFHLRTLLVLMTLTATASSIYAWRQRRYDYLCRLVEDFNTAMDQQQLDQAERLASEAKQEFPHHWAATSIMEKAALARKLNEGGSVEVGCFCHVE